MAGVDAQGSTSIQLTAARAFIPRRHAETRSRFACLGRLWLERPLPTTSHLTSGQSSSALPPFTWCLLARAFFLLCFCFTRYVYRGISSWVTIVTIKVQHQDLNLLKPFFFLPGFCFVISCLQLSLPSDFHIYVFMGDKKIESVLFSSAGNSSQQRGRPRT